MSEQADPDRHVIIIENDRIVSAVSGSDRHLRKIIVPHAKAEYNETIQQANNGAAKWSSVSENSKPVIESQKLQLSWVDEKAAQKPHWHSYQTESYFSQSPIDLIFRPVDNPSIGFQRLRFKGRALIPPRTCHLVKLSGMTEVLQIKTAETSEPIDLEFDQTFCQNCIISDVCSEESARMSLNSPSED